MAPKKQEQKQSTIEQTLGRPKAKPLVKTPKKVTKSSVPTKQSKITSSPAITKTKTLPSPSSFMGSSQVPGNGIGSAIKKKPLRKVAFIGSSDSDSNSDKDAIVELPVRGGKKGAAASKQQKKAVSTSKEDEETDDSVVELPAPPERKAAQKKPTPATQDEEESDDSVIELPSKGKMKGITPKKSSRTQKTAVEEEDDDDDDDVFKITGAKKQRGTKRKKLASSSPAADEDSDDTPLVIPSSSRKKRRVVLSDNSGSDSDSDDDDQPVVSSTAKRRRLVRGSSPIKPTIQDKGSEDDDSPTKRPSSVRRSAKKPLTAKEKARELLRRKRAGEVVNEDDSDTEDEDEEPVRKGLYDTDSDNVALSEFEDDDEEVEALQPEKETPNKKKPSPSKKGKSKTNSQEEDSDNAVTDSEDSLDDFVVDDPDGMLGVPDDALMGIPLEFTRHSHKKLKDHFRDVVEWLVQYKVNPGFSVKTNKPSPIDDEVRGLAQSKFASSAWQIDFHKALRARPERHNTELPKGDSLSLTQNCGACGRSGHPATWVVQFTGPAYIKKFGNDFLDPIEPDTDSSDTDDKDADVDEDGNSIPKETKQWFVGSICNINAQTAHDLYHWKHALLEFVEARLAADGYMTPAKLAERVKWKPKKLHKLVDEIVQRWEQEGMLKALFREFQNNLEKARNQSTTGRFKR
ncbi:hypothetical protein QBC35DRAFT_449411 [Podospora australis]|uniref:DUF4211 domain-containing protein n=1 Tax=Podospora australis TaxID=1536484 RepID=A0AAN6X1M4_9PEZI|nr:hypothetical protein QBC35DRAFT_449411 [Podospora australis]